MEPLEDLITTYLRGGWSRHIHSLLAFLVQRTAHQTLTFQFPDVHNCLLWNNDTWHARLESFVLYAYLF